MIYHTDDTGTGSRLIYHGYECGAAS